MALVTGVTPAHPAAFEEVKDQVRDAVVREKADKLAGEKANELYQKAASMGGDLKKAAQSMGLEVKTSDDFDRQGAVEGVGQATYLNDAFAKPVGTLVGPVAIPDARVVYKVVAHKDAGRVQACRAAHRHPRRAEVAEGARTQRAVRRRPAPDPDQGGQDQDSPGCGQPFDVQLPRLNG